MRGLQTETLDGIPLLWIEPERRRTGTDLVLWLPALSQPKENLREHLEAFAESGFVALSFDTWEQGERTPAGRESAAKWTFGNFRRRMWPAIGQSALEALRVLDWAIERFDVREGCFAGGISMGGDVSVAAAGIDRRIRRVAASVATPDWMRPGMTNVFGPGLDPIDLEVGRPDSYAQAFYDWLNPITHMQRYVGGPAITFECGAEDRHVPAEAAIRFQQALPNETIRVSLHRGAAHYPGVPAMFERCLEWFTQESPHERGIVEVSATGREAVG